MQIENRVWKLGHDIDTDVITPGKYLYLPMPEIARHTLEVVDPRFAGDVRPGDIVLAGRNFGCGSSREHAARVLRVLGVGCVLAESFARIFHRNAIAVGLPALEVPGLWAATEPFDVVAVDLRAGRAIVRRTGSTFTAPPLPERLLDTLRDGGILGALERIAAERRGGRG